MRYIDEQILQVGALSDDRNGYSISIGPLYFAQIQFITPKSGLQQLLNTQENL